MMMKKLFTFGSLLLILALASTAQAQDEVSDLLGRINNLRSSQGLPGYTLNGALNSAAYSQAQWMVETGQVAHSRPDGSTPRSRAAAAGYPTTEVSENIYGGSNADVNVAWTFWINSAIHYRGLINTRYKEIGIGVARGGWGTAYVLVFGNPGGPDYVPPAAAVSGSGAVGAAAAPSFVVGLDPHGNIMHEVQDGDTLGDIALIYGYTWAEIPAMLVLNGLNEADIRELEVGSVFLVPPQDGTYTPTPGGEAPTATPGPITEPSATGPAPTVAPPTAMPSPTLIVGATSANVPASLLLTNTPTPETVLVAAVPTNATILTATSGTTTITPSGTSPWLGIALVVQVGVLAAAGFQFFRRGKRKK